MSQGKRRLPKTKEEGCANNMKERQKKKKHPEKKGIKVEEEEVEEEDLDFGI